jgi:hypothetical protein
VLLERGDCKLPFTQRRTILSVLIYYSDIILIYNIIFVSLFYIYILFNAYILPGLQRNLHIFSTQFIFHTIFSINNH